jgi:hypothetical protein
MAEAEKPFMPTHNEYVFVERHALQDNIILYDAKCGILLAFGTITLLWCLDKLVLLTGKGPDHHLSTFATIEALLYAFAVLALLVTVIFTWKVIRPRIQHSHDHIYWGSKVFTQSQKDFTIAIQKADQDVLAIDMLHHLHVLAGICREKFANFERAIIAAQCAAGFIFLAVCVQVTANLIQAG